jgi:hypothetical protein
MPFLLQEQEIATSLLRVRLTVSRIILRDKISEDAAPSWHINSRPPAPDIPAAQCVSASSDLQENGCTGRARRTTRQHSEYKSDWKTSHADVQDERIANLLSPKHLFISVSLIPRGRRFVSQRLSPLTPGETAPSAHLIGRWEGPLAALDAVLERNISDHPARSVASVLLQLFLLTAREKNTFFIMLKCFHF